ncbi:hypothetical protein PIB30_070625 [Stylosanthes scabra]|uniref:PGG domain-containing protein n=1 Tax=Stylosanthes scabra TaxID=79078 RepID=A0ABU6SNY1_9FABA|nr:hypothetical protein [Stylosanthes scabra]
MAKEICKQPQSEDSDAHPEIETSYRPSGVEEETESEPELPDAVSPILTKHGEHKTLEFLGEVYHLARGGAVLKTQESYSSNILKEFKSPMENTVLHIAALYGNDEMADRAMQQEPNLVFSCNKNKDTPLHVAARAGHISTIKKLLDAYCVNSNSHVETILGLIKKKNKQGNTMLHEAMKRGSGSKGSMIFDVLETYTTNAEGASLCYELALNVVNKEYQSVLNLAVEADHMEVVNRILEKCPESAKPKGIPPIRVAMENENKAEMLETIVRKKEEWIHLRDPHGTLALHFAAGIGYLEGVVFLLERCKTCSIERDKEGNLPLHLAARQGHVEVVKELLRYCPDLDEMLDWNLNNILHIAAESGMLDVVRYILQTPLLKNTINQRNKDGDTPLHVATRNSHPSVVYALTWDYRVKDKVNELNSNQETPLAVAIKTFEATGTQNPSLRQSLTKIALKSAGAKPSHSIEVASHNANGTGRFRDRVESLSVISTLTITALVAACLAVPGDADGTAKNLKKAMFHLFIFCITISLFTSISATIVLILGRLGVIQLLNFAMKLAMPLPGTALVTLSLAFMAGIYTLISKLTWLATTFLVITSVLVAVIFFLYMLLLLPSSSPSKFSRNISYYPFIFLASLAEKDPEEQHTYIAHAKGDTALTSLSYVNSPANTFPISPHKNDQNKQK